MGRVLSPANLSAQVEDNVLDGASGVDVEEGLVLVGEHDLDQLPLVIIRVLEASGYYLGEEKRGRGRRMRRRIEEKD